MSADLKATPGPWRASPSEPPGQWLVHAPSSPWVLAYSNPKEGLFPEEANAHLISAAPDLYAALANCGARLKAELAEIKRFREDAEYDAERKEQELECDEATQRDIDRADAALRKARGES